MLLFTPVLIVYNKMSTMKKACEVTKHKFTSVTSDLLYIPDIINKVRLFLYGAKAFNHTKEIRF